MGFLIVIRRKSDRQVDLTNFDFSGCDVSGKDITSFIKGNKNQLLEKLVKEMHSGFQSVAVTKKDEQVVKNALHFLNILGYVEIKAKK